MHMVVLEYVLNLDHMSHQLLYFLKSPISEKFGFTLGCP